MRHRLLLPCLLAACASGQPKTPRLEEPPAAKKPAAPAEVSCEEAAAHLARLAVEGGVADPDDAERAEIVERCKAEPWSPLMRRCILDTKAFTGLQACDEADAKAMKLPVPSDVAAPPADAQKSASGLASKVLSPGRGDEHPQPQDVVTVHYTGWTVDGKEFDSSVRRNQPAELPLRALIPGFAEGLQLMVLGEKRRLWIPQALAYQGQPGKPAGMLVFDIELMAIQRGQTPLPAPAETSRVPADARKSKSGVAWKTTRPGKGKKPSKQAYVTLHYGAWDRRGVMIESSVAAGRPHVASVDNLPPIWAELIVSMAPGQKVLAWAEADESLEGRVEGQVLYELELISFVEPPAAPRDVKKPPGHAKVEASGLASVVLKKGTGKVRPTAADRVQVHYTGWTTDGKLFDSSVVRGKPTTFPLAAVIPGWREGVLLMVEGEKRRLWIPESLAYQGQAGAPAGVLVFDVELIAINPDPAP